jgi:LmbE family N-acetylglucosaminyl deacetylase
MAHPDDVDFSSAGTVARWVSEGSQVAYCIVTDGDAGGFDPSVDRAEIPAIRRAEQTEAARAVGVQQVEFLGYRDGRLTPSLELRRDLSRVIRQVRPDLVISQSPERNYQRIYASHPDHLAAGEAALCAVYPDARNPFAHPELAAEGLEAHSVGEVWLAGAADSDVFVDITDHFDTKIKALRSHASQLPDPAQLDAMIRGWNTANAVAGGLAPGRLAEGFRRVVT